MPPLLQVCNCTVVSTPQHPVIQHQSPCVFATYQSWQVLYPPSNGVFSATTVDTFFHHRNRQHSIQRCPSSRFRPTYRALLKEYTSFSASSTLPSWFVNQPNESSWYLSCLAHVFFHHVDIIYSAWQHVTSNAKLTSIYQFNIELK